MASNTKGTDILGIDCGNVIFRSISGKPLPEALEDIKKIAASGRFERIYVISKITPLLRFVFLSRLWYLNFWRYTGIPRNNIYFCRHHEDKAVICEKLGVTHFVDDRLRVLHAMKTVGNRYLLNFNVSRRQLTKYGDVLSEVKTVGSWSKLYPLLMFS
ncbi:hypothetical protein M1295_00520 [Patescibacteria group bacterium]|nr:hypothetical protein [Patescibacteria group bacterium]